MYVAVCSDTSWNSPICLKLVISAYFYKIKIKIYGLRVNPNNPKG